VKTNGVNQLGVEIKTEEGAVTHQKHSNYTVTSNDEPSLCDQLQLSK